MELVSGQYVSQYGMKNFPYALLVGVEEGLEMGGMAIFLYALLVNIKLTTGSDGLAVKFDQPR